MGLELVENLLVYQWGGQFEDGNQVPLNQYGGSWGAGTLLVEPGDPDNNQYPYNLSKCGSFVTKLLNQSYNWSWSNYPFFDPNQGQQVSTASPNAHRYMELITQQVGFKNQLFHISDVLPGDIMVKRDVGTTIGHVWIIKEVVLGSPMPYPANQSDSQNHLIGTTYYEVDVLDCSEGYHTNDTRKVWVNNQLHETHGAGVGTVGLLVDGNGVIIGHTWSLPKASYNGETSDWVSQLNGKIELLDETELVIGRLNLSIAQSNNMDEVASPEGTSDQETVDSVGEVDAPGTGDELDIEPASNPWHLELGRTLLSQIEACHAEGIFVDQDGIAINRYGGSWSSSSNPLVIRFADLDQGILPANNTKGATLVTMLLKEAYDLSWRDYEYYDSKKQVVRKTSSPGSSQYVDLIEQQQGFAAQIHQWTDAQPGDVMAIRYLANWSGHTVMIHHIDWSQAVEYPTGHASSQSDLQGTWFVPVEVLDATAHPHSHDTRDAYGQELEGIGTGYMGVLMDESGHIVGHTWSLPSANPDSATGSWLSQLHSRLKRQTDRKMVIGRF